MLHLMGIGYKKEHITIEELEILKNADKVYLEYYTSFYENEFSELEELIGKDIVICDREMIESKVEDEIIIPAKDKEICLVVLGDPLIATTHTDLLLRAKELDVKTQVYNNVSVGNYITKTGLQFYKFGRITSIPFFNAKFMPRTPYLVYLDNHRIGAHSLFLLDLNPSNDVAYKGTEKYLKAADAFKFLQYIPKIMVDNEEIMEEDVVEINDETQAVICSRLGFSDEKILYGEVGDLISYDKEHELREPICIIIPGDMHEMELTFLKQFDILKN